MLHTENTFEAALSRNQKTGTNGGVDVCVMAGVNDLRSHISQSTEAKSA